MKSTLTSFDGIDPESSNGYEYDYCDYDDADVLFIRLRKYFPVCKVHILCC